MGEAWLHVDEYCHCLYHWCFWLMLHHISWKKLCLGGSHSLMCVSLCSWLDDPSHGTRYHNPPIKINRSLSIYMHVHYWLETLGNLWFSPYWLCVYSHKVLNNLKSFCPSTCSWVCNIFFNCCFVITHIKAGAIMAWHTTRWNSAIMQSWNT